MLVYFIVGYLVWLLVHMLRDREEGLHQRIDDLEATRSKLIEEEKLAAVGRLASAVAHEIRNPVAIISSALETSASPSFAPGEREEMRGSHGWKRSDWRNLPPIFSPTPSREACLFNSLMPRLWLATSSPSCNCRLFKRTYKLSPGCAIPVAFMEMRASCSRHS